MEQFKDFEIFDHHPSELPPRNNDYQDWLKKLSLKPGEFAKMQERLNQHPSVPKISFHPANVLDSVREERKENWEQLEVTY